MGRRSGGAKKLIPVVGHPYKKITTEKWSRQAQRQGKGQIIDHIFYWFSGDVYRTHHERDSELREIEQSQFDMHPRTCDIGHETTNDGRSIPGGPQFKTVQFERTLNKNSSKTRGSG